MGWADRFRSSSVDAVGTAQVLLFHRVCDPSGLPVEPDTAISTDHFRQIIAHVASQLTPLSLDALLQRLRDGDHLDNGVAVTFDDGFADNLQTALPVLEEFQVPATVYVTSGFVSGDVKPLEYELSKLIAHRDEIEFDGKTWSTASAANDCYQSIRQALKPLSLQQRETALRQLWQGIPGHDSPAEFAFLSVDQLRQLDASPLMTIGAHTHAHQVLTAVTAGEAKRDISIGKEWLERQLGHAVVDFAYPYGAYDAVIEKMVRRAGMRSAVTTMEETVSGRCNLMALPRIEVNGEVAQSPDSLLQRLGR